jgi:hypothetical protein
MNTPSIPSPNVSQIKFSSASDRLTGNQNSMDSRSATPGLVDLRAEGTDDDSDLIALGKQFEEIAAKLQELYDPASPNDHLKLILLRHEFSSLVRSRGHSAARTPR